MRVFAQAETEVAGWRQQSWKRPCYRKCRTTKQKAEHRKQAERVSRSGELLFAFVEIPPESCFISRGIGEHDVTLAGLNVIEPFVAIVVLAHDER